MSDSSRFDYVQYDQKATDEQAVFKKLHIALETRINNNLQPGRARSQALAKLEECYMWVGKGVRDDQITRKGGTVLREERINS